ncbi:MAG: TonB-dependent receptor, partial [Cytophagales bacterium]|nr:TonB-dependent receptor [Cytophagales bacterium]
MQQKFTLCVSLALFWALSPVGAQEMAVLPDTTGRTPAPPAALAGSGAAAVTAFAAEGFNRGPILYSPLQLIQGRVPGLAIMRARGGDPLQEMPVQLRGTSTLYGNTNLLYVIDGVPQAGFNAVLPEDIESIEVLRSASATARYGMRGANGVLKVTTRKGSSGRPVVTYGAYGYFETVSQKAGFFTAREWREAKRAWAASSDPRLQGIPPHMVDMGGDTDWLREIRQQKVSQLHHLSVAGGSAKTHYYAAAGYRNLHGALRGSGNRLVNGRVSLSQSALKDKLTFEGAFGITPSRYHQYAPPPASPTAPYIFDEAESFNPTVPLDSAYWQNRPNPVTQLNNTSNQHDRNDWLARAGARYQVVKGLTLSALLARERLHRNSSLSARSRYSEGTQENTRQEAITESSTTLETTLDYRLAAAGHHLDLLAGYATQEFGIALRVHDWAFLNGRPGGEAKNSASFDYGIASFFGSASYGYKNRYLLSASLRRDQSPTYVANASPVYYPAFNLGWRLNNEPFLQKWSWLSQLMLRAGYGVSGRMPPLHFGLSGNTLVTPNLRGEKLTETNFGVDLGVLADRLLVRVDHYRRTTSDLILPHTVPSEQGFTTLIINQGTLYNRGWEVALEGRPVNTARFRWNTSLVASFNRNEVQVYREGAPDGLRWGQPVPRCSRRGS